MAQSLSSAAEHSSLSNSAARADLIRDAVRWLAEREAEVRAINADIRDYRMKHIKGDLGFKLSDWAAIYRVSQLEVDDRDALIDTLREGFAAIGVGQIVDWVDAAQATPRTAPADDDARRYGRVDGLNGTHHHADEYPQGEPGHGDYMLGLADGEAERERAKTPRRRGRPRKQQQAEADAEF